MAAQVTPDGISRGFGTHTNIQHNSPDAIQIIYKAEFDNFCCECNALTCADISRKYFYVLENAYESNFSFCCTNNCLCPNVDNISKSYFDRGIYDQQSCARRIGCVRGTPVVHAGNVKNVCFCMDCCECWDNYVDGCHYPGYCGDRVRVLSSEYVCICIPTRSNCCCNCMGLCGPKTGEPLTCALTPVARFLRIGTGPQLAQALEGARAAWKARTGST